MSKLRRYRFRAEVACDIALLSCAHPQMDIDLFQADRQSPVVVVSVNTDMSFMQFYALLETLPNSRLMLQTVRPALTFDEEAACRAEPARLN